MSEWDASQIKQPGWHHVEAAFIEGAREARANPEADEAMFRRAADGYTKRVFEEVDPVSEAALRTGCWGAGNAGLLRAMCDEKGMACDCGIPDELWERAQTEAVGINGLTEAETNATASVFGLSSPPSTLGDTPKLKAALRQIADFDAWSFSDRQTVYQMRVIAKAALGDDDRAPLGDTPDQQEQKR